ncbi:MAG: hypothetical protein ACM3JJ_00535 [Hyphomicrobiales bacterium]
MRRRPSRPLTTAALVLLTALATALAAPRPAHADSVLSAGGLGEPSLEENARLRALGGAGAAEHGPQTFSLVNPASIAEVEHLILEGTLMPTYRKISSLDYGSETARETALPSARALIRLPGSIVLGGAYLIGTNARFRVDRAESSGTVSSLRIDGTGGIDLIRISLARRVSPSLNLGIDYELVAGSYREEWRRAFSDTALALSRDTLETSYGQRGRFRLGAQLVRGGWSLGAVYELPRRLPLTFTQRTAGSVVERSLGDLRIPAGFVIGGDAPIGARVHVVGQYRRADWSRSSLESPLVDFRPMQRFSLGVERRRSVTPGIHAPLLDRIPLRVGATFLRWPDLLPRVGATDIAGGEAAVEEWAVSIGSGIQTQDRGGALDFSLETGSRGSKDRLGVSERFVRFAISLRVSDDTWR